MPVAWALRLVAISVYTHWAITYPFDRLSLRWWIILVRLRYLGVAMIVCLAFPIFGCITWMCRINHLFEKRRSSSTLISNEPRIIVPPAAFGPTSCEAIILRLLYDFFFLLSVKCHRLFPWTNFIVYFCGERFHHVSGVNIPFWMNMLCGHGSMPNMEYKPNNSQRRWLRYCGLFDGFEF